MIKKDSPLPIYYQLEQGIRNLIENKQLKSGDAIPSEREYSQLYGISRMTVRQAINNLVNDGYLERIRGKGTFVAFEKIEQPLKGLTSFSEDMRSRGLEPSTCILHFSIVDAGQKEASLLEIAEGSSIIKIERLRLADQEPMAYESLILPYDLVPGLTAEIAQGSIYEYVESKLGLRITSAIQELQATTVRKKAAEQLNIHEGAAILSIQRKSFLENKRPFEVVQSFYRADRYKFTIEMER